jgi:hypothetical protein
MTTFVNDKLTNVGYYVCDGPMVDLVPSPPFLGFLQLLPTFTESPASPKVLIIHTRLSLQVAWRTASMICNT